MSTPACELCGAEFGAQGPTTRAGVALCHRCGEGDFADGLPDILMVEKRYQPVGARGRTAAILTGAIPYELGIEAEFAAEDIFDQVSKLFVEELQVGDPDFDDAIFIKTEAPRPLAPLLRRPDLRRALLTLVELSDGPVCMGDDWVAAEVIGLDAGVGTAAAQAALAVFLHHLQRFAIEAGCEHVAVDADFFVGPPPRKKSSPIYIVVCKAR